MSKIIILTILVASSLSYAVGTIDAAVMKFKIYKIALSASTACTSPNVVLSAPDGVGQNMIGGANFGSPRIDAGTYPCVMIEVSKIIKTRAATTTGFCNAAAEFSDVVCQDGSQDSRTIDGATVNCSGGAANDQHVTLYITTISAGTNGSRALIPPINVSDTTSGLNLSSPFLVVQGANRNGNLNVNFHNFLSSSGGMRGTNAPGFTFN